MAINNICIIGGGTAGWLAANHLGTALAKTASENGQTPQIQITLIESPDIPTIGVGEGTVPTIRESLARFGIKESEFIRRCDATFKQSIKFINWMDSGAREVAHSFHHLFDAPSPFGHDLSNYWLQNQMNAGAANSKEYAKFVAPQWHSCERKLAPKTADMSDYKGAHAYAYHLNAAKFAELLSENATSKFDVKHLKANVVEVELAQNGAIAAVHTENHGRLAFDFFVDCSGTASLLMEKALAVPFVNKQDELLVNKAIVVQVPTKPDDEIPPYTLATAHQAGWIWDIALTNRRGVGLVYGDEFLSEVAAKDKLDRYLGNNTHRERYRTIDMRIGHLSKFWHKNCVALGLAQGFVEPLEATSILLTDFAASFLARKFPRTGDDLPTLEQRFNQVMTYAWKRVIDFIKLHYYLSDRVDSPFWLANKNEEHLSETLKQRLQLWRSYTPHPDDFFAQFEVFTVDNYLYLLYGMNYPTTPLVTDKQNEQAHRAHAEKIQQANQYLKQKLPSHRQALEELAFRSHTK